MATRTRPLQIRCQLSRDDSRACYHYRLTAQQRSVLGRAASCEARHGIRDRKMPTRTTRLEGSMHTRDHLIVCLYICVLTSGCFLKRTFQVDPCLVPHNSSNGARQGFLRRLYGTEWVEPTVEDTLKNEYGGDCQMNV